MSTTERILQETMLLPPIEKIKLAAMLIQQPQETVSFDEERRAAFREIRGKYK
jgi:hypothetical protein